MKKIRRRARQAVIKSFRETPNRPLNLKDEIPPFLEFSWSSGCVKNCSAKEKSISKASPVQVMVFFISLEVVFLPGSESGFKSLIADPDPKLTACQIRIRNKQFQINQICKKDLCSSFYKRNVEAEKKHGLNCLGK